MLLQGTIIAALILGLFLAWSGGSVVCFAAIMAWRRGMGWFKGLVLNLLLSAMLLALVAGIDAWSGVDDLSLFTSYMVACMGASVPAIAYLAFRAFQRKT